MTQPSTRTASARSKLPWKSLQASARAFYEASPLQRIAIIKRGVPASYVQTLAAGTAMPKDRLYRALGLPRATIDRKMRKGELLSQDESERVLAITRLVGQASNLVRESGDPAGFDAAKWVAAWLQQPHPALNGRCPGEFMDTADGRALLEDLLAQQQSSAYA